MDDALGRRVALGYPNSIRTSYDYSKAGRLIDISAGNNLNDPLARYSYSHDAVGNRTGRSFQLRNDIYTYDPTYQLSRAVKQMLDPNGQVEKTLKEQYS